jgi:hypothetical protein
LVQEARIVTQEEKIVMQEWVIFPQEAEKVWQDG